MLVTEPCCYSKHLQKLFTSLGVMKTPNIPYLSNGDWCLGQLIEWIIWLAPGGELSLIIPSINGETYKSLMRIMERKNCSVGKSDEPLVKSLKIVCLKDEGLTGYARKIFDSFPDRVSLGYANITDTNHLLISGNSPVASEGYRTFSIVGSLNQDIDYKSRIIIVSKDSHLYDEIVDNIDRNLRLHRL